MLKQSLSLFFMMTSSCFALPYMDGLNQKKPSIMVIDDSIIEPNDTLPQIIKTIKHKYNPEPNVRISIEQIKKMLESSSINENVIDKVLTTLQCANNTKHNAILTIIDYSRPSSEKRLWVFHLKNKTLLFHTYVSHGIKSGINTSSFFSNKYNSKASSIGVYTTEQAYYGRHGLSLKLEGLDRGFNDNASNRAVVMHGGWYVDDVFIHKYGRAGRSWGCPALPDQLAPTIINTIKNKSLFVAYYPSDDWFKKSKFQNCKTPSTEPTKITTLSSEPINEQRDNVLFLDKNNNGQHEEMEPILALSTENYRQIFQSPIPLDRMLRRQIHGTEYIALSDNELNQVLTDDNKKVALFNHLIFVIPKIVMEHGYYATEMQPLSLGKIKSISFNTTAAKESLKKYTIYFEKAYSISLKSSGQFIRWVGL